MRIACWALATIVFAAPAVAQPEPVEPSENTIVVTGSADGPSREEVYDQALDLSRVNSRYGYVYEHALARFEKPVCPGVAGLKDAAASELVERIRANAARFKIRLAKGSCAPNLVVAFVEDGQTYVADLERKYPRIFSLVEERERAELLGGPGPVRVLSNVVPRMANGAPVRRWKGKWRVPTRKGMADRVMLPSRTDIDSAVVVFDREAVVGMSVTQLADYATMRGLSHTRPASGDESLSTILGLFADDSRSPEELTSFDIGYLKSLYWWKANVPAVDKLLGVRKRAREAREEEPTS